MLIAHYLIYEFQMLKEYRDRGRAGRAGEGVGGLVVKH